MPGPRINPKFLCSKCNSLLTEPMQTPCGHLICYHCLEIIFRSSNPVCPEDGTKLTMENVFLDAYTKRELMAYRRQCSSSGCDWSGPDGELQAHLDRCPHFVTRCPQCKQEVKIPLLHQHSETECPRRRVLCTFCNEQLAFYLVQNHVDFECLESPLTCQHCAMTDIPRKDMAKHEQVECQEIPIECEFKAVGCDHAKVSKRKELHVHKRDGLVVHMALLLKFVLEMLGKLQALIPKMEISIMMQTAPEDVKNMMVSLSIEVKGLSQKFVSTLKTITGLKKTVEGLESKVDEGRNDPRVAPDVKRLETKVTDLSKNLEKLEEKIRKLENENREKQSTIERLQARLDQVDHSLALTTVTLSDIDVSGQGQAVTSTNGILLWKIDNFTRKRQEAVSGFQIAIYSPPFYSGQFGYKMCARMYMNGDGFGKNTHISLFFVIMKGEYDALLPWPFQKKITMMLLDQNNGEHMIDAFRADHESSSFQRPKNNMNVASGSPLFMPLNGLSNRAYVKDDTMFIKIIVD